MTENQKHLDEFGELFIKEVRDRTFGKYEAIKNGNLNSESAKRMTQKLSSLELEGAASNILDELALDIIDRALFQMLFMFVENEDRFRITSDEINSLVDISDGLHGELFSDEGWIRRFSQYPDSDPDS